MKKNILLLLTSSLLFFIAAEAQAQNWCLEESCCAGEINIYGKILGGVNFLQDRKKAKYDTGYIISASLGYCWRYGLCVEGEYAFRRNAIRKIHFFGEGCSKHGHFQTSSFMVNLLWDMPLSSWGCSFWNIRPYVGAGIGYDTHHLHSSNSRIVFRQKWHHFSWQMMVGLAYEIFCNTDISLEYKYHHGGHHFDNNSLGVGVSYKFGLR